LGTAALAATAFWLLNGSTRTRGETAEERRNEPTLPAVRRTVAEPVRALQRHDYAPKGPERAEVGATEAADTSPSRAEVPEQRQTFGALQQEVQAEVRDSQWAREVDARLRADLQADVQAGRFRGAVAINRVDCGNIRCAVQAEASNRADSSALGSALTRALGLERGRIFHRPIEGGGEHVEVVAARAGYDIFGRERRQAEVRVLANSRQSAD
ncbi:MAG TPA: hypothetical protein VGK73_09640, partial [Polyangiaceae bacterium]